MEIAGINMHQQTMSKDQIETAIAKWQVQDISPD